MAIPIIFILPIYLVLVIVFFVVASINAMHVFRYGKFDLRNRLMVTVFTVYTVAILVLTIGYFLTVDWSQTFEFSFSAISFDLPF